MNLYSFAPAIYARLRAKLNPDTTFCHLLKGTGWLFTGNLTEASIGIVQNILLARVLGVEQLGILAIITSFTYAMGQVFDSRSWETSTKFLAKYESNRDYCSSLAVIKLGYIVDISSSIFSFLLSWSLASWIATEFLSEPSYTQSIRVYSFVLLFNVNGGTQALARSYNRYQLLAKIQVCLGMIKFIGILTVLYLFNAGLNGVLVVHVITGLISLIVGIFLLRYFLRTHLKVGWKESRISLLSTSRIEIVQFMISTNITQLLKVIQRSGAVLVLGYLSSPIQVGYYKLAQSFAQQLLLIFNPVFQTVYPEFSKLWSEHQFKRLKQTIYKLLLGLVFIGLLATLLASLLGKLVIGLTVGDGYYSAYDAMMVLVIVYSISGILIWVGPLLLAIGQPGHQTLAVAAGSIAMLISLFLSVPRFGAVGAAIASLTFYVVWGIVGVSKIYLVFRDNSWTESR
jgi:O-antigen/teichoic acid export membrane protein